MEFPFTLEQASSIAGDVDLLFLYLTGTSTLITVFILAVVIYSIVKYRREADVDRSNPPIGNLRVEGAWILVLFVLAMGTFVWGAWTYFNVYAAPAADGIDIYVVGKQWMWKFVHPTGQREINELHVPAGRTINLTMISQDVIHSFFVPAFRIKKDVLPGRYTTYSFEATRTGEYHLFCAEYCGTEHAEMIGRVVVMEPRQYQNWLQERPLTGADVIPERRVPAGEEPETMADAGARLFQNLGCISCHQMDGSGVGPSLVGVFGEPVPLESGQTVVADMQYIRDSILDPNAQIVAGYPPIMPTYEDQVTEEELLRLVEYIQALGTEDGDTEEGPEADVETDAAQQTATPDEAGTPAPTTEAQAAVAAGEELFQQLGCMECHLPEGGGTGPSLVGVFGRQVELESGETVTADEEYIRNSILNPNEQVVAGFEPVMPEFEDQLDQEQLSNLVAYIESLGNEDGQQ